jgi:hypothetical protein
VKFRALLIGCAVVVATAGVVFTALPTPHNFVFARWAAMFTYAAALVGAGFAVVGFARGDRLRWAWMLMASYAIIGLGKVILWGSPRHIGPAVGLVPRAHTPVINGVATILLNVCSVWGLVLFSRVWNGTGLTPPWRTRATTACVILGLAMGGVPVWNDVQLIRAGQTLRIAGLASSLGDIAAIALIGPILVTAIAMRGGLLVWPWTILTISSIAWLLFDAVQLLPVSAMPVADLVTVMTATITTGAAGLAHRWAVTDESAESQ